MPRFQVRITGEPERASRALDAVGISTVSTSAQWSGEHGSAEEAGTKGLTAVLDAADDGEARKRVEQALPEGYSIDSVTSL